MSKVQCDMCQRAAVWSHPLGGRRCGRCHLPSPTEWAALSPPEPRITPAMVCRLAQNVRNQRGWRRISAEDRATTLKTIRNWVRKENARAK